MTTTIAKLWMMVAAATATAAAQDPLPDWPERTIHFEKIDEPLEIPISQFGSVMVRPKFAATIVLNPEIGDRRALSRYTRVPSRGESGGERFLKDTGVSGLSEDQRKLMKIGRWMEAHSVQNQQIQPLSGMGGSTRAREIAVRFLRYVNDGTYFYTIYAVTEEDVHTLARAAVKRLNLGPREIFEQRKLALPAARKQMKEGSARLKLLEKEAANLDAARKAAPFADDDEAGADMADLAKSLRGTEIEIAGIRAKMEAIDGFKAGEGIDDSSRSLLDRLTIELDVDLAGALARKSVLQRHYDNAQSFRDAYRAQRNAKLTRQALGSTRSRIESLEAQLFDPPNERKPVALIDDKIVIQPITYTE